MIGTLTCKNQMDDQEGRIMIAWPECVQNLTSLQKQLRFTLEVEVIPDGPDFAIVGPMRNLERAKSMIDRKIADVVKGHTMLNQTQVYLLGKTLSDKQSFRFVRVSPQNKDSRSFNLDSCVVRPKGGDTPDHQRPWRGKTTSPTPPRSPIVALHEPVLQLISDPATIDKAKFQTSERELDIVWDITESLLKYQSSSDNKFKLEALFGKTSFWRHSRDRFPWTLTREDLFDLTIGPGNKFNTQFNNRGANTKAFRQRLQNRLKADGWKRVDQKPTQEIIIYLADANVDIAQRRLDIYLKVNKENGPVFIKYHKDQLRHHAVLECNAKRFPDYRIRLTSYAESCNLKTFPDHITQAVAKTTFDSATRQVNFTPPPQVFISTIRFKEIIRYEKDSMELMVSIIHEADGPHTQIMLISKRIEELLKQEKKEFREMEEAVQFFFDTARRVAEIPWESAS